MKSRRKRVTSSIAASLTVGVLAGGAVAAQSASSDGVAPDDSGSEALTASPESDGDLTIGPWQKNKPAPDLVPVTLKDGRSGFLRSFDLAYGSGKPEFTRSTGKNSEETVLPVYEKDGQTQIGEFVAGTASWE